MKSDRDGVGDQIKCRCAYGRICAPFRHHIQLLSYLKGAKIPNGFALVVPRSLGRSVGGVLTYRAWEGCDASPLMWWQPCLYGQNFFRPLKGQSLRSPCYFFQTHLTAFVQQLLKYSLTKLGKRVAYSRQKSMVGMRRNEHLSILRKMAVKKKMFVFFLVW